LARVHFRKIRSYFSLLVVENGRRTALDNVDVGFFPTALAHDRAVRAICLIGCWNIGLRDRADRGTRRARSQGADRGQHASGAR
jgi:hypothetical protein